MDRRAQRRETRKQEMLDAAMGIVLDEGIEALTIARIAARLDAAVGALYRYFPGKEALIVGLQEAAIGDVHIYIANRVAEVRATGEATPLRVLVEAHRAYLTHAYDNPATHKLVDTFFSSHKPNLDSEHAKLIEKIIQPILAEIDTLHRAAVDSNSLDEGDLRQRTHIGWVCVHGMDHFRKRDWMMAPANRTPALFKVLFGNLLVAWGAPLEMVAEVMQAVPDLPTRERKRTE